MGASLIQIQTRVLLENKSVIMLLSHAEFQIFNKITHKHSLRSYYFFQKSKLSPISAEGQQLVLFSLALCQFYTVRSYKKRRCR